MNLIFGFLMGSVLGSFFSKLFRLFSSNKHAGTNDPDAASIAAQAQLDQAAFELGAERAEDMMEYIAVAKWFTMSSYSKDKWRGALPGQLQGFASFTIWSFLFRIVACAAYAFGALEISKVLAASEHWNATTLAWQFVLPVILYTTLIGRTRWLLSWFFVPISLAYGLTRYRTLAKTGEYGAIAIGMHSYPVLLSYGTLLGVALAWMTGQHGQTSYSLIVILSCASVFTLVAAAVLGLVPRVLFNRGKYRVWSTSDAFRSTASLKVAPNPSNTFSNTRDNAVSKSQGTHIINDYRKDVDHALSTVRPYDDPGDAVFKGDIILNLLEAKEQLLITWKHNLEHQHPSNNGLTDDQQFAKRQVLWEKEGQLRAESDAYYTVLYQKSLEPTSSSTIAAPISSGSKMPNLTRETSAVAYTDLADIPIFRWDSAFPTIDGHPGDIEPQLMKDDDGTFHFDSFLPLRPPTAE